ncbi:hypothetical protein JNK13_11365 [bacterium]|nr:hypothetical protein [bacterium]
MKYTKNNSQGFALVYTLMMLGVLSMLSLTYFLTTKIELASTRQGRDSLAGFYTAEAGMNVRAAAIRTKFVNFNLPSGTSPSTTNACQGSNLGAGDFACQTNTLGQHSVTTYIIADASNPYTTTIPGGEKFSGLTAYEYRYTAHAESKNISSGRIESILELKFKSRTVPLYQFAYFYNKDLTLLPGAAMSISGRIHVNNDIYLDAVNTNPNGLSLTGQVTVAGDFWRGDKAGTTNVCRANSVRLLDPVTYQTLSSACGASGTRVKVDPSTLSSFNQNIVVGFSPVGVPPISSWASGPGHVFWDRADLRLALMLNSSENADTGQSATGIIVVANNATSASQKDSTATTTLNSSTSCPGALSGGRAVAVSTWKNYWINSTSGADMRVLDVDVVGLFNCLKNQNWFGWGKTLADTSDGGIVIHLTVIGPNSSNINRYGVRLRNAAELKSTVSGAPTIKGLTIASDQNLWTLGNFNSTNKKPAALLGETYLLHSNQWNDANTTYSTRNVTASTTVNAAIVSGSGTTGGIEGIGGQGGTKEIGLIINEENFNGKTITINGALVSLHRQTRFPTTYYYGSPRYSAPTRVITYDTSFNNPANLPPLSLMFVYLKQELFIRDYEQ